MSNRGQITIGAIRYGDQNPDRELTTTDTFGPQRIILSDQEQTIKQVPDDFTGIIITDFAGNITTFPVPSGAAGANKLLATNDKNQLVWVDR